MRKYLLSVFFSVLFLVVGVGAAKADDCPAPTSPPATPGGPNSPSCDFNLELRVTRVNVNLSSGGGSQLIIRGLVNRSIPAGLLVTVDPDLGGQGLSACASLAQSATGNQKLQLSGTGTYSGLFGNAVAGYAVKLDRVTSDSIGCSIAY